MANEKKKSEKNSLTSITKHINLGRTSSKPSNSLKPKETPKK